MKVRLVLERKRKRVWAAELKGPEATIGRSLGNTVRIPSSEVSRLHCRLRVENGVVTVEDLESVNGTFLNGARVRDIQVVRPGDRLTVGPATLLIEYQLTPEARARLAGAEAVVALDADDEIEIVGEAAEEPAFVLDEPGAGLDEALPVAEAIEEPVAEAVAEDDAEMFILDGDEAEDFIIELDDDTDERKGRAGR